MEETRNQKKVNNKFMKKYLFLDNDIYSPDEQTGVFGKEVVIDKRDRDEIWFTVLETGKKGYVVYPSLFCPATELNINKVRAFKENLQQPEQYKDIAYGILKKVKKLI